MTWLSKDLTLDLIAIVIHGLTKASERIAQEPNGQNWPPEPEWVASNQPVQHVEKPEPEPTPAPDTDTLLTEAKTLLQTLSRAGHREWIKDTLLPKFNVSKLTDVPASRLPELIDTAKAYQKETA